MNGYTYGGEVPKPSVTGNTGGAAVTYFYNTKNSNKGGTPFEGITNTTIDAGTYYLYAEVSETDEYAGTISAPVKFTVAKKAVTVTAKDQAVIRGENIQTGPDNAILEGAVGGHYLAAVTLTPSSVEKVTDAGAITASVAVIKDRAGNAVTGNYETDYHTGKLTVAEKLYSITVSAGKNGSASAKPSSAPAGKKIDLTAKPNAGYKLKKWTVTKGVKLKDAAKAKTSFTMPEKDVTVKATFEKINITPIVTMKANGKNKMDISWTKIREADGYDIFFAKCNTKNDTNELKCIKTIKNKKRSGNSLRKEFMNMEVSITPPLS